MRLIDELSEKDKDRVLEYYNSHLEDEVEYEKATSWLDDFLASLGFKLIYLSTYLSPVYRYTYDNKDEIEVRHWPWPGETRRWQLDFCYTGGMKTNKFKTIDDLIEYMQEI